MWAPGQGDQGQLLFLIPAPPHHQCINFSPALCSLSSEIFSKFFRRRGWQRMRWLHGITDLMDVILSKFWEILKDREACPSLCAADHQIAKSWKWLSEWTTIVFRGFPGGSAVKNLPANAGNLGSIPGLGRSSGEGNGNPLKYFCLGNPMDREAWQATVHGVSNSQMLNSVTRLD